MKKLTYFRIGVLVIVGLISLIGGFAYLNSHVFKSKASENELNISIWGQKNIDPRSLKIGQKVIVNFLLKPVSTTTKISAFSVKLSKTGDNFSISSISTPRVYGTTIFEPSYFTRIGGTGTAAQYVIKKTTSQLPNTILIPVAITILKKTNLTSSSLSISASESQVVGPVAGYAYNIISSEPVTVNDPSVYASTPVPTTITQPSPTTDIPVDIVSPGPVATLFPTTAIGPDMIRLIMSIRFQGVTEAPVSQFKTINVRVGLAKKGEDPTYKQVSFAASETGIWTGNADFTAAAGTNYIVYVKGPKHLQKKICDALPTEDSTKPGTYHCLNNAITLKQGDNNLNFSGIALLAGDLPDQSNTQQGLIDSTTLTRITTYFGKKDAASLNVADVDMNGRINTQDYVYVLRALSIKYDEE
ncbi:hypothetical protein HGB07_02185 [Candidatus Roizmanbacteria bacterium]|nr:hypothetical protein [Candidatus Roizmanbacteria bacterium]